MNCSVLRRIPLFAATTLLAALAVAACPQNRQVESEGAAPQAHPAPTFDFINWRTYLGDPASSQYSSLAQINRANVRQLKIAWTYNSGGLRPGQNTQIQCNPLIIDRVLFGSSADARFVFALESTTGEELWKYDTQASGISRGLTYWENGQGDDRRLFFAVGDRFGVLDPENGRPIASFGDQGMIDLRKNLGRDVSGLLVQVRTPGAIYKDMIIIGSVVSEGPASAPGHVRNSTRST